MQAKTQRNKQIVKMRDERKMTFEKIGKIMHLSRQRVAELYYKEKQRGK